MSATTDETRISPAKWASIATAADQYNVSDDTIRRMIDRGEITAVRIGPRLVRVDLNSIPLEIIGGAA